MFHVKRRKDAGLAGVGRGSKAGLRAALMLRRPAARWVMAAGLGVMLGAAAPAPAPQAAPEPAPVTFTDNAAEGEITREFGYTWPAAVSATPQLVRRFTAERTRLLAEQKAEWAEARRDFTEGGCTGCLSREYAKSWDVVTNLPRFLSLSSNTYEYAGGAHGNYWSGGLVWDRKAKRAIEPEAMFTSAKALQAALGPGWCAALKAERAERLGPDYTDDGFFPCPPIKDLTVLVGSSDKRYFNRIGLIADPYVAGSYAEGAYEVTLPVSPRVIAAVKPQYRAAFAPGK